MRWNMVSGVSRPRVDKRAIGLHFICLLLTAAPVFASGPEKYPENTGFGGANRFLPVDEAFQLGVSWQGQHLSVGWYIKPGYYLYRHRVVFSSPDATLGKPVFPKGQREEDPYFGKVEIYRDELLVDLPVVKSGQSLTLKVRYQGCADAGYCYPPQQRTLKVAKSP